MKKIFGNKKQDSSSAVSTDETTAEQEQEQEQEQATTNEDVSTSSTTDANEISIPSDDGEYNYIFLFAVVENGKEREVKISVQEDSEQLALKKAVNAIFEIAKSYDNMRYKSLLKKENA